ncbi:MAG: glycosyltransferase family 2 protein [bacterium]
MKLSVIMPVYNEKDTIEKIIKKIEGVNLSKEIIIIDDYSSDGTREIIERIENKNVIKIFQGENKGKGSAIRAGLERASGDIIIIQDGDLEYSPEDYYKLVKPIMEGKASVVYGSRVLGKGKFSYLRYALGGKFLSFLTNILYGSHITDEPTCYKVFKAEVIKSINLKCKRFEFCPEVTAKVLKKGYKILELPISYYPRKIEEGKKINYKDGLKAIWTLIKYRFFD